MKYYPVFLDLQGRTCLVIGERDSTQEKASQLSAAGARVIRADIFDPETARDAFLIVAVLEDPSRGRELFEFGERNRIIVNVVDQPEHCAFITPALVDRGNLLIAISTSGKSPTLASQIRQKLENQFGSEYSELLEALAEIRPLVKSCIPSFGERKDFYANLIQADLLETVQNEGLETARVKIRQYLETWNSTTQVKT